jgi:translation initiation factor 2 subunit 3
MKKNINQLPDEKECKEILNSQRKLSLQSFANLKNISEISPLTQEIMSRQATINIGTFGDNFKGKTTLVQSLSESNISRPKAEKEPERIKEKEKNISQNFGYINVKLYKCKKCQEPECYKSYNSETDDELKCKICGSKQVLIRHICFVDEPEFKIKMLKILNGSLIIDGALLFIAANENCDIQENDNNKEKNEFLLNSILKNIIIIQNKIDTVMKYNTAKEQYEQIKKYANNKNAPNSPIIPISAQLKYNLDVVIQYLSLIPIPKRDFISPPKFAIIHSFDCNYQSEDVYINNNLNNKTGMIYGLIFRGILKLGEQIEIRPGICIRVSNKEIKINPITTKIVSLQAEKNNLIYAITGGIINVGLKIDPLLCRGNILDGNIVGLPDKMEEMFIKIVIKCHLLRRLLIVNKKEWGKHVKYVTEIKKGEILLLNIGFVAVGGFVTKIEGNNNDEITFLLKKPVCCEISEKVAISRKIGFSWRIIGWGEVISGGETINAT